MVTEPATYMIWGMGACDIDMIIMGTLADTGGCRHPQEDV